MLLLRKPSDARVRAFLTAQRHLPFSYPEVGATRGSLPHGYAIDHNRVRLGTGAEAFGRAVDAVRRWQMFRLGWVELCWPDAPIETGATVGILVSYPGIWWLNAARVVYILDEDGPVRRFGFAYGTLPEHAERGEERFTVEWLRADDSVWYDLLAFSRPKHALAVAGYPFARALQRRFARDSKRAMLEACSRSSLVASL